ncbi:MAG: AAA family ATPase, partial [Myxococcota bacterium]|nr:AAA family ATPase [Myxococcota bacterium]
TPMAISRLIGTPSRPDGELTGRVRLQPFCVVLLDEIEKAHGDVHDLLLQVLGDGRLTDAAGRTVDFRNAVLVMTSNLGAGSEDHWLGFHEKVRSDRFLHYKRSVEAFFRPEFFNRIDHIVPFNPLGHGALRRIARRTLRTLLERRGLRQAQLMVDVDEALIDYLIEGAVDPRYGARTLGRRIERALITPLASRLTTHQSEEGLTRVSVRVGDREEERIALDLQVIRRAPQQALAPSSPMTSEDKAAPQWVGEDGARTALDAQQLVDALHRVAAMLDSLEGRKEIRALSREYHSILAQFNDPEQQEDVLEEGELAERLRQREVVLKRLAVLRSRLDGVLDPRGTGEYVFPIAQEIDRRKQRAWSSLVSQLEHELLWLEVQLRSLLTREADSATLVVAGLSGPFPALLSLWLRVLRAIDEVFSLDLTMVELSGGKWRPLGEREDNRQAIAVSTEAPGLFALFDTLEGYAWSPRLPSHGQHALALLSNFDKGFVSQEELIARLDAGEFATSKERGEEACIEFIEQRGQLEDVRLGRFLPIPEDRATNLQQFALRLVMPRVASSGAGVYGESMRSGMHRALTQEDLDGADTP